MKKVVSFLLSIILVICFTLPCFAADVGNIIFVDSETGNDLNNGKSESSPLRTLEAASSKTYSAGDKILLKAGAVFDGSFSAKGGGTAENPVILGAYGDTSVLGQPIIRSGSNVVLVDLHNVSGWVVDDIEFTAPDGKGIYITADNGLMTTDITVKNCTFHDIWYKQCADYTGNQCPIMLSSSGAVSRLRNITLQNCNIYDCAYGIVMNGLSREWTPDLFTSPEKSYNTNYVIDGISLNNILYDAVIIMSVYGMVIKNCSLINTSLNDDYYTAPMWSHHASNYVIENCEFAGSKNEKDGMTVDFDGWTTDATYQYIYSHDNVRFIQNCCYDNYTKNENCTVRYCLSVNDNKQINQMASILTSGSVDYAKDEYAVSMDNFKFYNNTLVNCSEIFCHALSNSVIANNIFIGNTVIDTFQFTRKNVGDNGEKIIHEFDGIMTNNCFWGMGAPYVSENNYFCNPRFVGSDLTDKNSFMLSASSKLIGKGIQVEDDMGEYDFYGNMLSSEHNIGCYEGIGETTSQNYVFFNWVIGFFKTILSNFICFINNCNNRFWLF